MNVLLEVQSDYFYESLRSRFTESGSFFSVILVVFGVVGLVALVYAATQFQRRRQAPRSVNDADALYRSLVDRLPITDEQRRVLTIVEKAARLPNPAVLLISRKLFDEHAATERTGTSLASAGIDSDPARGAIAALRCALFGYSPASNTGKPQS